MYKKTNAKNLVFFILIIIIITIDNTSFAEKHWAHEKIQYLLDRGIVSGYSDGDFRPDKSITRAEFIKIINNSLGLTKRVEVDFKDVKKGDWFYEEIEKAIDVGYIHGYEDNTLRPNNPITREEAAKVISLAFGLDKDDIDNHQLFKDNTQISNWSKEYVYKLYVKDYVSGYSDSTFRPKNSITRGEVIKIITNISGDIVNSQGNYSNVENNNLLISTPNVNLNDVHIKGDLFLVEGVGDGRIVLDNVIVDGTIYIKSGELIIKSSNLNKVIINKRSSQSPIILDNTLVSQIIAGDNTNLIGKNKTNINFLEIKGKSNIEIGKESKVEKIEIKAEDVELNIKGDADLIISEANYKLNEKTIERGREIKVKDGKIVVLDSQKKPQKETTPKEPTPERPRDDEEDPDNKPIEKYEFIAELDKTQYTKDEDIRLFGKVLQDNKGFARALITFRIVDNEDGEIITADQIKTSESGEFETIFKLPKEINLGEYSIIIKVHNPVEQQRVLGFTILDDELYNFTMDLNKTEYKKDEEILVKGKVWENNEGLNGVDISLKLLDKSKEVVFVEQVKTNILGDFLISFKIPGGLNVGEYKLILKANEPVNIFREETFSIGDL